MDSPTYVQDAEEDEVLELEWVEVPRLEALQRIENMLTEDLVAFEIDAVYSDTPLGGVSTYTWLRVTDDLDQVPVLLAMRDPTKTEAPLRWFLHRDLVVD